MEGSKLSYTLRKIGEEIGAAHPAIVVVLGEYAIT